MNKYFDRENAKKLGMTFVEYKTMMLKQMVYLSNSSIKLSILMNLVKQGKEELLYDPTSEYSWIFSNMYELDMEKKISSDEILDFNKLVKESDILLKPYFYLNIDNSPTNESPDFVIWNSLSGEKVGIEITNAGFHQGATSSDFTKYLDENGNLSNPKAIVKKLDKLSSIYKKNTNMMENMEKILKQKCALSIKNKWKPSKIILCIKFPIGSREKFYSKNIQLKLLLRAIEINSKYDNPFVKIVICHDEYNFNHLTKEYRKKYNLEN